MIIKHKFIMLCLAFLLILPGFAYSGGNPSSNILTDCDYDDQGDFNTDDNCGTAAATCEWTFELVCPAEVTCEGPVDLGIFCAGDVIRPTGDDDWIVFRIGGEAGRHFRISVDVDENAVDEDGNYENHIVLSALTYQLLRRYSNHNSWSNYRFISALDLEQSACTSLQFQTTHGNGGECVSADNDERNFQIRIRPSEITTEGANSGMYTIRISLGVDFGYQF